MSVLISTNSEPLQPSVQQCFSAWCGCRHAGLLPAQDPLLFLFLAGAWSRSLGLWPSAVTWELASPRPPPPWRLPSWLGLRRIWSRSGSWSPINQARIWSHSRGPVQKIDPGRTKVEAILPLALQSRRGMRQRVYVDGAGGAWVHVEGPEGSAGGAQEHGHACCARYAQPGPPQCCARGSPACTCPRHPF